MRAEERALALGAGFHLKRKRGERGGAGADLQPVEVVREDLSGDLGGGVAFLLVDRVEQVEGVGEHVPGAAGRDREGGCPPGWVTVRKSVSRLAVSM